MKKILSLILSLCVVFSSICASANATSEVGNAASESLSESSTEPKVYELSLEQAIAMAYENNGELKANQLDQKGKNLSVTSANLSKKELKDITLNPAANFEMYCVKKGYYLKAAKVQAELSKGQAEQIKSRIAYDVTEAYYKYVLVQKLASAAQNAYELATENFALVSAQYDMGLISKLDYENAAISVKMAENALLSYKMNCKTAEQNLKILIHKDEEDCTIKVSDYVDCSDYSSDVEADIKSAMESRYDITALKKSAELAYEYFDVADVLTSTSAMYHTAYASYVKADYDYSNTKKLIALRISTSYNSILTAKADMDTAKLSYEMKVKQNDSAKLKYELGMITNLELTQSINELYESQTQYANAKVTYRLAVEKYKKEITVGL